VTDTPSRKTSELERLLVRVALEHAPAALASSLSAEDMVITDVILRHKLGIEIFTLDTQRLHADTLNVIAAIRARYGYERARVPSRPRVRFRVRREFRPRCVL